MSQCSGPLTQWNMSYLFPMTETRWLTEPEKGKSCDDLQRMLQYLRGKASPRKMRLFACACCRLKWHLLEDARSQRAVSAAEQFADAQISKKDLAFARLHAFTVHEKSRTTNSPFGAIAAVHAAGTVLEWGDEPTEAGTALRAAITTAACSANCPADKREQIALLRHIFGNPFRPYPAPDHWPLAVVELAAAVYDDLDCCFALHDALLDAGHAELAEHFREPYHPKGCWALDLILGKS